MQNKLFIRVDRFCFVGKADTMSCLRCTSSCVATSDAHLCISFVSCFKHGTYKLFLSSMTLADAGRYQPQVGQPGAISKNTREPLLKLTPDALSVVLLIAKKGEYRHSHTPLAANTVLLASFYPSRRKEQQTQPAPESLRRFAAPTYYHCYRPPQQSPPLTVSMEHLQSHWCAIGSATTVLATTARSLAAPGRPTVPFSTRDQNAFLLCFRSHFVMSRYYCCKGVKARLRSQNTSKKHETATTRCPQPDKRKKQC